MSISTLNTIAPVVVECGACGNTHNLAHSEMYMYTEVIKIGSIPHKVQHITCPNFECLKMYANAEEVEELSEAREIEKGLHKCRGCGKPIDRETIMDYGVLWVRNYVSEFYLCNLEECLAGALGARKISAGMEG